MWIELPGIWIISLNVGGWLVIQMGLAWVFTKMPAEWFGSGSPRGWENGGRFYERAFAIQRWKDRLPDAGRWFAGGFAKGMLTASSPDYIARFIRETRRGELCHITAICFTPVFVVWNPWWASLILFAYAVAANLPCILVQRYNRLRLTRLQSKMALSSPG